MALTELAKVEKSSLAIGGNPTQMIGLLAPRTACTKSLTSFL